MEATITSRSPFATFAAVILLRAKATVIAKVGRNLVAAHPLVTFAAVVLLRTKTTVVTKPSRCLTAAHPLVTFAAVVLLRSESTVVAQVSWMFAHHNLNKINMKLSFKEWLFYVNHFIKVFLKSKKKISLMNQTLTKKREGIKLFFVRNPFRSLRRSRTKKEREVVIRFTCLINLLESTTKSKHHCSLAKGLFQRNRAF